MFVLCEEAKRIDVVGLLVSALPNSQVRYIHTRNKHLFHKMTLYLPQHNTSRHILTFIFIAHNCGHPLSINQLPDSKGYSKSYFTYLRHFWRCFVARPMSVCIGSHFPLNGLLGLPVMKQWNYISAMVRIVINCFQSVSFWHNIELFFNSVKIFVSQSTRSPSGISPGVWFNVLVSRGWPPDPNSGEWRTLTI